jgi:hypothetical protein
MKKVPYVFEEEWIDVMFAWRSKVRMRDGKLSDLKTKAMLGVDQIFAELAWYRWHRLAAIPEAVTHADCVPSFAERASASYLLLGFQ